MGTNLHNYNITVNCSVFLGEVSHYFSGNVEICRAPLVKIEAFHVVFKQPSIITRYMSTIGTFVANSTVLTSSA